MTKSDTKRIREMGRRAFVGGLEVQLAHVNLLKSNSLDCFYCTQDQLKMPAELSGWRMHYPGDWGHPRGQKIVKLEPNL